MTGDLATWSTLTGRGGGPVVLTIDFGGAREEAGFAELAPGLPAGVTALATRSPAGLPDGPAACADQLDRWHAEVGDRDVVAVLGYCAGAAVATWLAGELAVARVVLLDPATTTAATLLASYRTSSASLIEALGRPADPDEELAELATRVEASASGLLDLAARLVARYERTADEVGSELGLSAELVGDLVGRFTRYLAYLVITRHAADLRPAAAPATLSVVSAVHPDDAFPAPGQLRRFDVSRPALLAEPAVGRAVAEFIDLPAPTPVLDTPHR